MYDAFLLFAYALRAFISSSIFANLDRALICGPYANRMKGTTERAKPRHAAKKEAHWYPKRLYICVVNKGKAVPAKLRHSDCPDKADEA